MLLIFLRHGVAEEGGHGVPGEDEKRELVKRGVRETRNVADVLKRLRMKPDLVLTSPLVRAVQTAKAAAGRWKKPPKLIEIEELAPGHTWSDVIRAVNRRANADDTVMLVGHQPSLGEHVIAALGGKPVGEFGFPKSGCIAVSWDKKPGASPGSLQFALSPKLAKKILAR